MPASDRSVSGFFTYLKILLKVKREDVVYLQRTVYNKYFILALLLSRVCGVHFIFDIDDAVYEHSPTKTKLLTWGADFVTCGSTKIQDWCLRYNKKSYVLTNSIPLAIYTPRTQEIVEDIPTIGWIGTLPEVYVVPAVEALRTLVSNGQQFKLRIIGAMGNPAIGILLKGFPNLTIIDSLNWADPQEAVEEIKKFTIGIMPLTDSDWDQVKYFKALEYMACSVPIVASNGSTVREILLKHKCGFVAEDTGAWVHHLTMLLENPALRHEMGERGRAAIEAEYAIEATVEKLQLYIQGAR
jgi:glycosyltransferase involved in cell wall biosynthesis